MHARYFNLLYILYHEKMCLLFLIQGGVGFPGLPGRNGKDGLPVCQRNIHCFSISLSPFGLYD